MQPAEWTAHSPDQGDVDLLRLVGEGVLRRGARVVEGGHSQPAQAIRLGVQAMHLHIVYISAPGRLLAAYAELPSALVCASIFCITPCETRLPLVLGSH